MRTYLVLIACLFATGGCREDVEIPDGFCATFDLKGTSPPDLSTPPPKCAAAAGLPGDNLVCADFTSPQTLTDLTNAGWDFDQFNKNCWTVSNGKLQVIANMFSNYSGTCGFLLPKIAPDDYGKYNSFTLSIVHTVDISDVASQTLLIMMGADDPKRLVDQTTGRQPRKQWTQTLARTALPGNPGAYQPLLKLSAINPAGSPYQGWQIESIAVNGIP